jgi:4-amino-4-deoxy-L-arabinose transferase-like glycosyltransferase
MPQINYRLLIVVLGALFFIPFLGSAPLFDWDEANFAESAREMLVSGNYSRVTINFQPFWEKPPLFIWMQAACMRIFGVSEFSARLPNALFGVITLLTVFNIGVKIRNERLGFLWAMMLMSSFLPHVYFKSGIIDPVFNYFIFLAIWHLSLFIGKRDEVKSLVSPILAGLYMGLAVLTKGPVGILIPGLVLAVFTLWQRFKAIITFKQSVSCIFALLLPVLAWLLPEVVHNGFWFVEEFIAYQIRLFSTPDAGHAQPFYYHFVVVLFGCFPASVFGISMLFSKVELRLNHHRFALWMRILLWTVLILFSIVTTKIVHYSSLAYLPLCALAAISADSYLEGRQTWRWPKLVFYCLIGSILGAAMLAIPYIGKNIQLIAPYIKEAFASQALNAKVEWPWYTMLPGIIWLLGLPFSIFLLRNHNRKAALYWSLVPTLLATSLFLVWFPWRISQYSQGAAIDFYSSVRGKKAYLETFYFKSYAQYFYSGKTGLNEMERKNCKDTSGYYHVDVLRNWYLTGAIDRPFYFVIKNDRKDEFLAYPDVQLLEERNGFIFMMRKAPKKSK